MAVTVKMHPDLDATSYVSVVEFTAWCAQNLKDISGKSADQLAKAVNDSATYIDTRFSFVGYRKEKTQLLEWPRENAWDNRGDKVDGIPAALKAASCGYAFMALSQELMDNPVRDESGRVVKSKDEKVGPISTSVEYEISAGYEMPIYPAIDRLLFRHGLVLSKGGISSGQVGRA